MHGGTVAVLQERAILSRAMGYMEQLRAARVRTVQDAIEHILAWQLPTSWSDSDLAADGSRPDALSFHGSRTPDQ